MVIVDEVKVDFYKHICRQHVLLLCGMDVDSLCACKILQAMFKADDVEHTVIPVSGWQDVKTAYNDHAYLVKCIVLINCGGKINLLEFLEPETDEIQFFIIDSHRPLELDNVFNEKQITIVLREGERLNVPEFDQIYSFEMEEEDEEEECYSDQDEPQPKRSHTDEKNSYEVRRKRHLWRRKREELLNNYYEMDYHETAASLVMYELACKLNRDGNEVVWPAIVGLTEQLLYEKITTEVYWDSAFKLEQSVRRHNRGDADGPPAAINLMRLSYDNELKLALYRHWSFYDSLRHSEYTVTKFKMWSMKGQKKLLEFLATMGMPLSQAEQKFPSMELKFRQNLKQLITESAPRFSLDSLTYASFVAQFGYKTTLCAADVVYSVTALMEDVEASSSDAFFTALESLSMRHNLHIVQEGIELAKQQQVAIMGQVRNFLDSHKVACAGPFLYAYVEEGTPNVKLFTKILTLGRLARFLRESWVAMNKRARDLPFIVTAPLDDKNTDEGMCLVIGVPAHTEDSRKSEFSRAFQQAANRIQAHATFDHFSGSVVEIKKDERGKFLDTLVQMAHV